MRGNPHGLQMTEAGIYGQFILGFTQHSNGVNTVILSPRPVDVGSVTCIKKTQVSFLVH